MNGTIMTRAGPEGADDAYWDPITGAPDGQPVGGGPGGTGGAIAGAALGLAAAGVAGGLGGEIGAETVDPTAEDAYWQANYAKQKYVDRDAPYATYQNAFRIGYVGRTRHAGRTFEEVEADLESDYQKSKGSETLSWDKAKEATRDAWHRVEQVSGRETQ